MAFVRCRNYAVLSFVLSFAVVPAAQYFGLNKSQTWLSRKPLILSATGVDLVGDRKLPLHWDWRNAHGRSFVVADVNQHIPLYCGSCWIHGTVAQLNDRIKVMRNAAFPDVMISRQALNDCVPGENGTIPGCFGGDSLMIYNHMQKTKVPDETCSPYQAKNDKCLPWTVCRNCEPPPGFLEAMAAGADITKVHFDFTGGCRAIPNYIGYTVSQFGEVNGSSAMMKEIYARGPISCTMFANDDFVYNYARIAEMHEGVFVWDEKFNDTDHVVEVTGWGETPSGLKYWVVRNSWGTYWGQGGWFKIRRGVNQNLIEADCSWAIPEFGEETSVLQGKVLGDYVAGTHPVSKPLASGFASGKQLSFSAMQLLLAVISATATSSFCILTVVKFCHPQAAQQRLLLG